MIKSNRRVGKVPLGNTVQNKRDGSNGRRESDNVCGVRVGYDQRFDALLGPSSFVFQSLHMDPTNLPLLLLSPSPPSVARASITSLSKSGPSTPRLKIVVKVSTFPVERAGAQTAK